MRNISVVRDDVATCVIRQRTEQVVVAWLAPRREENDTAHQQMMHRTCHGALLIQIQIQIQIQIAIITSFYHADCSYRCRAKQRGARMRAAAT